MSGQGPARTDPDSRPPGRGALTGALPRVGLGHLPTPLEPAPRLGAALGGLDLWVKREDQSGLAFGGNKVRQLEFILAAARAADADTVLTTAGSQSNFCRALAAGAARLGLGCVLLLRGTAPGSLAGNLLLDRMLGAEIHYIATEDPYDPAVRTELERLADGVARRGGRPYLIQLPGVSGPLAAAAAADLAEELAGQGAEPPDTLYLAVGSGLTAAGLVVGFTAARLPTEVIGISVQQPTGFIAPLIAQRSQEAARLLGLELTIDPARLVIDDRFIEPGYGRASARSLAACVTAARTEALLLDPIYSGKALAGLAAHAAEGRLRRGQKVVFVHSGGGPGLFAQADAIAGHLQTI